VYDDYGKLKYSKMEKLLRYVNNARKDIDRLWQATAGDKLYNSCLRDDG